MFGVAVSDDWADLSSVGSRADAPAEDNPRHVSSPRHSERSVRVIALRSHVWFISRVMRPDGRGVPNADPSAGDRR